MTDNKYWIFLERLRRSGEVNMCGAAPRLANHFGINYLLAESILKDWMKHYNRKDYEGMED